MGVVASLPVVLPLMIWANVCFSTQAARYYCENGAVMKLDVSREPDQCESLFPITVDSAASLGGMRCRWEISAPRTDTAVVILSGFNISKETPKRWKRSTESQVKVNSPRIQYQLHGSASSASRCSTQNPESIKSVDSDETFRVILLTKESLLTVTFDQASITKDQAAPGLRVQVVEKEFCTRETLNFQRRCHRVSTVPRSLTDELAFINGDSGILQLASFNSTDAIQSFVEFNKQKTVGSGDEVRSREPLNLNQAVRIGLFMDKQRRSITYLTVSEGQCQMKVFQASENFTDLSTDPSHACGSLRVDQMSGRGILEFRNCNESLAALISFADTPRDCSNCSETIVNWIRDLESEVSSHRRIVSFSGNIVVIALASVSVSIILAVGIVVAMVLFVVKSSRKASKLTRPALLHANASKASSPDNPAALLHPQQDHFDNPTA